MDNNRGSIAILVALLMPVLLSFLALVADVGAYYVVRSQLQTMADAASLAGASFSDNEIHVCDATETGSLRIDGGDLYIKMYVEIDEAKMKQRARKAMERNMDNLIYDVDVSNFECKPIDVGETWYWGRLEMKGGKYNIDKVEFDSKETLGANNSCYVKIKANMPTLLLGSVMSLFHDDKNFNVIPVAVESVGSFDCKMVFREEG